MAVHLDERRKANPGREGGRDNVVWRREKRRGPFGKAKSSSVVIHTTVESECTFDIRKMEKIASAVSKTLHCRKPQFMLIMVETKREYLPCLQPL